MSKKTLFLFWLIVFFLCGCETTKGLAEGLKKDTHNFWSKAKEKTKEIDSWLRQNLW